MTVLTLQRASTAADQYVMALQSAHDAGIRLYDPDYALAQDPQIGEKMRRDTNLMAALEHRLTGVAGPKAVVEPYSDREDDVVAADIMTGLLKHYEFMGGGFQLSRYKLANAVIDGRAYGLIEGKRAFMEQGPEGTPEMRWWHPTRIKDVDERRFRWVPTGRPPKVKVTLEFWSIDQRKWIPVNGDFWNQLVSVTYEDFEDRLGYGRGLREALYHYYYAKGIVLREGLQGLERWAQGWTIAKIDTAQRGNQNQNTESVAEDYLSVLKKMRGRYGGMAIDKADEVETVFPNGAGHQMVTDFLTYLDNGVTRLIAGALLHTGAGEDQGSMARAGVEQNASGTIIGFDRGVLGEALTKDMLYLMWIMNVENLRSIGLDKSRMPRIRVMEDDKVDPAESRENLKTAKDIGLDVKEQEAYELLKLTPPSEGDKILEAVPAAGPLDGLGLEGLGFRKR